MRRDMRFPTMWYVLPAKAQTKCWATDWTAFGVWVYIYQNATLLEISCRGSHNLKMKSIGSLVTLQQYANSDNRFYSKFKPLTLDVLLFAEYMAWSCLPLILPHINFHIPLTFITHKTRNLLSKIWVHKVYPSQYDTRMEVNIDRDSKIRCQTYEQARTMTLYQVIKVNKQWLWGIIILNVCKLLVQCSTRL